MVYFYVFQTVILLQLEVHFAVYLCSDLTRRRGAAGRPHLSGCMLCRLLPSTPVFTPSHSHSEQFRDLPIQKSLTVLPCFTSQVPTTFNSLYLAHIQHCISLFLTKWHGILFLRFIFVYSCCTAMSLSQGTHSVNICQMKESFLKIISFKVN